MLVAEVEVAEAVAQLRAGVDALLAADLELLDGAAVASLMDDLEVQRRRLDAADVRVVAAADECRRNGDYAAATVVDLLVSRLRIDPREAVRRGDRALSLRYRRSMQGEVLQPVLPATAHALAAGEISARHADVIDKYVDKVSGLPDVPPEASEVTEATLLNASRHEHPNLVARLGEALLRRLDPDGRQPTDAELDRRRNYSLIKKPDGSAIARGNLTPEAAAAWEAVFDALAAPVTDADGTPDPRSAAQRRHDAMLDVANRVIRGELAPGGGTPLTALVRFEADQVPQSMTAPDTYEWDEPAPASSQPSPHPRPAEPPNPADAGSHDFGAGIGITAHGGLISLARLGCALCEAEIDAVVVNDTGGVLAFGRSRRFATKTQRLALAARDGGCSFPSCTRPAAWCEAHHVIPWQRGGPTDLSNLCLVCSYHHRHFERLGWDVVMINGAPHWIPPPWVDPARSPRRNRAHHPPDLDFPA